MVPVRILHCIPHLMGGGAERQLCYLAMHQADCGHDVHVAFLAGSDVPATLESSSVRLHPIAHRRTHDPTILLRLVQLMRTLRPDIVQTCLLQMDILGGLAARLTRTPWLLREPNGRYFWPDNWKARLRLLMARSASAIVSNSASGDSYWQHHLPAVQRFIVHNGVPIDAIAAESAVPHEQLGLAPGTPVILCACRLEPNKNVETLVRALACVCERLPATALICGQGSQHAPLARLIETLGAGTTIRLAGYRNDIWPLMKTARLFVSTSTTEGNPNSVLEAMASHCPIVLSDIPAHREMLDTNSAFFVEHYNDADSIAGVIVDALANPAESSRRSDAAYRRIVSRSIAGMAGQYDKVYAAALAGAG